MKKPTAIFFIFIAIFLTSIFFSYAVPAIPDPVVMTQPDGNSLTVMIKGDERMSWYETIDGYTLLFNQEGYLTYALFDEADNLQPSHYLRS